jgi:ribosomal protein S18 acetylase RimI-like enzyme
MITTRHIEPADFDQCGRVLDLAYQGSNVIARLHFAYEIDNRHWWLTERDGEVLGVGGAMLYEPHENGPRTASIGLIGVDPNQHKQGIGHALMTHLIEKLDSDHCDLSFLDATEAGAKLYSKLGYQDYGFAYRYTLRDYAPVAAQANPLLRPITEADLPALSAYDSPKFGSDRQQVLQALYAITTGRAWLASDEQGAITGYIFAQPVAIGPFVANSATIADSLLGVALSLPYADSPTAVFSAGNSAMLAMVQGLGFVQMRQTLHMQRGGAHNPRQEAYLYSQTNFLLG